jgi:hypothetical protein
VTDPGLARLARGFHGPWPYLKLLAGSAGVDDPFAYEVVEAYWVGNRLLDRVGLSDFGRALEERFAGQTGRRWGLLAEAIPAGAVAHHSFHVFGVYPWVGLLDSGRGEPLEVLDRCRIRWARVVGVEGEQVVVRGRHLVWDGRELSLGAPLDETAVRSVDGVGFVTDLKPGEWVSLHWDWVCDRLSRRQLSSLRHYSLRELDLVNHRLTHPGHALVMG